LNIKFYYFCVSDPHCMSRLSFARGSLLYYLEVNYHVWGYLLLISQGTSKLHVVEATYDNAIGVSFVLTYLLVYVVVILFSVNESRRTY
jgi:uncharacterized protein YybS (DUF2232 family)